MKLGIVSCYFINNYGSILQAYALQEYLSSKGIECDTISVEGLKTYLDYKKRQYYIIKAIQIKKGETNGGEQEK